MNETWPQYKARLAAAEQAAMEELKRQLEAGLVPVRTDVRYVVTVAEEVDG
jgi:hypothetical protein